MHVLLHADDTLIISTKNHPLRETMHVPMHYHNQYETTDRNHAYSMQTIRL